ncbi:MAG: thiamine phosphate synthase [Longimicrobiales bacterium]|nr:thiamine phosphate synthase [Longimicrobiales bacterium]
MTSSALRSALRVLVLTDRRLAGSRDVREVVASALEAGARAIQLRNKGDSAWELLALGRDLRAMTRERGALLFVNDRVDVAMALEADGVHVGPHDLPVAAVRAIAPRDFLVGRSTDDPEVARRAVAEGADYIGCGTVYATATKADAGEVIGLSGLEAVVRAVRVPVIGIGGITVQRAGEVARIGAAGVAVVGAVMAASDPAAAVRGLLGAFGGTTPGTGNSA